MQYSQAFIRAIGSVLSSEGGYSNDPEDPGNWTGGAKGKGELVGTKYGISAKTYPQLDIKNLNREQAVSIYWRDFWATIQGDALPPRVALVVFDSAVNQGTVAAAKLLQEAVGSEVDGVIGPNTIAATRGRDQEHVIVAFLALRAMRYAAGAPDKFKRYGKGWMTRLFRIAMESAR